MNMLHKWGGVCFFILFLFFPGLGVAQQNQKAQLTSSTYRIQVNDLLEVNVWKELDLTREVRVRRDGRISLPLVDEAPAAGMTPMELKKHITQRLARYIENPVVTVIVKEQGSAFYIIGEVGQIGAYPLIKNLSLVQAIALAGGFTEWANKKEMILVRRIQGQDKRYVLSYEDIVSGKKASDNVQLHPGDTIIVY